MKHETLTLHGGHTSDSETHSRDISLQEHIDDILEDFDQALASE